jgi:hypothetical protein
MDILKQKRSFRLIALSAAFALFTLTGTAALGISQSNPMGPPVATSPQADTVEVTLTDGDLTVPSTVESGEVTFEVTNEGQEAHGFALSAPGDTKLEERIEAGQERSFTAYLEAGTYTAHCPVENHEQQEKAEVEVE